jgi:hypothetical protein
MTCSTAWKSIQVQRSCAGGRLGETSMTCRGDRAWHAWREVPGTRETHTGSLTSGATARVFPYNRKGGGKTTVWESDILIVLGGRVSRLHAPVSMGHGEGVYGHA